MTDLTTFGIDPEWLAGKRAELGRALDADEQAQKDEDRKALLMQFAQSYANRKFIPVEPRKVGGAMAKFGADLGLEERSQKRGIDAFEALSKIKGGSATNPDNEPAPAEWGAPAGMSKKQAIESGYAKKEKPENVDVLEPDLVGRAKKAGVPTNGRKREPVIADILAAERAAQSRADAKEKEGQDKKTKDKDATFIDSDLTPSSKPLPPQVQADLQKRSSATRVVIDNAAQVERILKNGGPAVWGDRASELSMLINNIWTELKDIKNLGVLAGPDMGILQGIVSDPSQLANVLKDESGVRALLPQIQRFQTRMLSDMRSRVKGYGAAPVPDGFYAGPGDAARRPRRTDPKTGETREWDGTQWVAIQG